MTEPTHHHLFLAVPEALADTVRGYIIAMIGEDNGGGMLRSGYSPTGEMPVAHRVSNGPIEMEFWNMLQSPEALAAAIGVSEAEAAYLLSVCIVSGEPGQALLAELGWFPVNEEVDPSA